MTSVSEKMTEKTLTLRELNIKVDFQNDRIIELEIIVNELTEFIKHKLVEDKKGDNLQEPAPHSKTRESVHNKKKCQRCDFTCTSKSDMKKHNVDNHIKVSSITCKICEKTFCKNNELELHLQSHSQAEKFKCSICGKSFVLKWRLEKHKNVHTTNKFCHYFNNQKFCPYEAIGCKFKHERAPICKFSNCLNTLCQFEHKNENYDDDTNNKDGDESIDAIMAKARAFSDLEDSESEDDFLGCQGCGQKYGEFNCTGCKDSFCRNCVLRKHGQSIVCLNCADFDEEVQI